DVLGEGATAGRTHGDARLRLAALEALLDRDVTRFLQRLEMGAEISVGRSDQVLEPGELDLSPPRRERVERGHDLQPHGLMDDLVAAAHCDTPCRPSQAPPTMSVPLSTAAIQRRSQGSASRPPARLSATP